MYVLRRTTNFDKRLKNIKKIFNLTDKETVEILDELRELMITLQETGYIPEEYQDHVLEKKPWRGFHEFHLLDDMLVVYFKIEKKKVIRMVTITNHEELSTGKFIF